MTSVVIIGNSKLLQDRMDKRFLAPGLFSALGIISKKAAADLIVLSKRDELIDGALIREGVQLKWITDTTLLPQLCEDATTVWFVAEPEEISRNSHLSDVARLIMFESSECAWDDVKEEICSPMRIGISERVTSETSIAVNVNLDGSGDSEISTGIGFFDHMLTQIARHSGINLLINAKGDLHIDEHHTIEDTALALGEAISQALGEKRGITRYAFLLPMDEALSHIALDLSGRNWLVWEAPFSREKIGDMPTEMFYHFFKSLTDTLRCTLHIKSTGDNEHHKIEGIFKGFGKVLGMAVARGSGTEIPSSKGVL